MDLRICLILTLCRRLTIGRLQRQIKELEVKAPIANSLADETEKSKTNTAELQQVRWTSITTAVATDMNGRTTTQLL